MVGTLGASWGSIESGEESGLLVRGKDGWVLLSARDDGGGEIDFGSCRSIFFHTLSCHHCSIWCLALEEWVSIELDAREVLYLLWLVLFDSGVAGVKETVSWLSSPFWSSDLLTYPSFPGLSFGLYIRVGCWVEIRQVG